YNGGNIDEQNPLTGYLDYNNDRWKKAQDAAQDIINLNLFELVPEFKNVFITQGNKERIFSKQGGNNQNVETTNGPIGYNTSQNNGLTSPTQELVDAFGMANGLAIDAAGSGYDANNPYVDSDP